MLIDQIQVDLATALKDKKEIEVSTLRLLLSEIHNKRIALRQAQGEKLSDEVVVSIIRQQIKQRKEAIEAYQKGNREDLVQKESQEQEILSKYLPQQLTPEELEKVVKEVISELKATGPADFGKVMGAVMEKAKGKTEGSEVAELVRKIFSS